MIDVFLIILVLYSLGTSFFLLRYRFSFRRINKQIDNQRSRSSIRVTSPPEVMKPLIQLANQMITDYRHLEIQQKRFDRIRKEFLAEISHDIRTPLTSVIGYLDALRDEFEERKSFNVDYFDIIVKKSRQLSRRVDQFFDLAKIQSSDWKIQPERLDLAELIRETLIGFLPGIEKQSIDLDLNLECKDPIAQFDKLSFIRILENLVQNVLTHAARGKYLGISLINQKDALEMKVSDKGDGINLEKSIEIFIRRKRSSGARHSSGLGLYIVGELANKNKASVQYAPLSVKGSVFTLSINKP